MKNIIPEVNLLRGRLTEKDEVKMNIERPTSNKEGKMKPFFVRLIVIVIAVALVGQVAVAAEVTRVNPSEGHVYINKGKPAGFIVGAKVCIYLSSEETVCGKIFRTTDSYSVLRVDNRKARHIKYGMKAILMASQKVPSTAL